jgi:hypothetical protein
LERDLTRRILSFPTVNKVRGKNKLTTTKTLPSSFNLVCGGGTFQSVEEKKSPRRFSFSNSKGVEIFGVLEF